MMFNMRSVVTGVALLASVLVPPAMFAGSDDTVNVPSESTVDSATLALSGANAKTSQLDIAHSSATDTLLAKAETQFSKGREHYFAGDLAAAKRDFNAAIDVLLSAPDSLPDRRRVEQRLEEMCDMIYRFDVEKLGSGQNSEDAAVVYDKAPIDEISHMTFPVDEKLAPRLKTELNQTSSGIPLELADPVLSYVHYFSTDRGRKILLSGFRRSGRYRAMIQRVFAEEGVPQELIYLAQAESGFLPRALSYKRCAGMWQFKAETGVMYQLNRTSEYDDRLDPEKATRAAARHLRDLYARYGDWYLAMAAYNCGAGAVDRAVERTGYADYWELLKRHALPKETSNYVPIIVAMTIIAKNPQDYGLENIDVDPPVDYDTIRVSARTNLNLIADATMQPVSAIRDLNPALIRSVAPAGFQIHVPKGTGDTALASLETVPAQDRESWRLHHVLAGDTLDSIARAYHLSAGRIMAVNRASDSLEAGDVLLIPAAYHEDSYSVLRTSRRSRHGSSGASRHSTVHNAARISSSPRVSSQVLHRKAGYRTADVRE